MASVFFSYCHADEALRDQLEKHLATLKRTGQIEAWHDRRIGAGEDFNSSIDQHINEDNIILLLVSPDFISSDYCYNIEMHRALERHDAGEAIVIPVILRPCEWHDAPFGRLNATPPDGKPVKSFPDIDDGFAAVARAVKGAVQRWNSKLGNATAKAASSYPQDAATAAKPVSPVIRSSNLRLAKEFNDQDHDQFRKQSFEFLATFFEQSLLELAQRNARVHGDFERLDATHFCSTIYRDGTRVAQCTIFSGGAISSHSINYISGRTTQDNSFEESLSIKADDQKLYLEPLGLTMMGTRKHEKLTQDGAAEFLWAHFINRLQ